MIKIKLVLSVYWRQPIAHLLSEMGQWNAVELEKTIESSVQPITDMTVYPRGIGALKVERLSYSERENNLTAFCQGLDMGDAPDDGYEVVNKLQWFESLGWRVSSYLEDFRHHVFCAEHVSSTIGLSKAG